MSLSKGEVIANQLHVWKDTGEREVKFARCCLVAVAGNDNEVYYLTISTHNDSAWEYYQKFPEWNFILSKKNCEGIRKTSVVNLKHINKAKPVGKYVLSVPDCTLNKIIKKLKEWQAQNPDPIYEEIVKYI